MKKKLEELWEGTEEPFAIDIDCEGFDINEDDFEVTLVGDAGTVTFTKDDLLHDESGQWYVMVPTARLGAGLVSATITMVIPEELCPGGFRRETDCQDLCYIIEQPETVTNNGMCKCYL